MRFESILPAARVGALGTLELIATIENGEGVEPRGRFRRYAAFGLTLIQRGHGQLRTNMGISPVGAGDAILTLPEVPHWFGPDPGTNWDEEFAVFHGPQFNFMRDLGHLPPNRLVLPGIPSDALRRLIPLSADRATMSLAATLLEALPPSESRSWLSEAQSVLARNLEVPLDLASVARGLGLGYETFRKTFRRETGMSPARFRARRRLETAQALLRRTSLSVSEVAERVGYADSFCFSKAFRAEFGLAPSAFRRNERAVEIS